MSAELKTILAERSSTVAIDVSYTSDSRPPQKKKSRRLRSGKHGGLPRLIHRPGICSMEVTKACLRALNLCKGRAEADMPLRRFRRQYEQLLQFKRGEGIIGMMEAGWSARRVARQLGHSDCVGTSGSERCHLYEDQAQDALDRPVVEKTTTSSHFSTRQCSRHTARASQDCLLSVTTLHCPSRSPDFSQIEHIWDHLGRRVGHPPSLNELEARLQQIWNEMSQGIIQNLYASMPDRIALCIRARKGSTGKRKSLEIERESESSRLQLSEEKKKRTLLGTDFLSSAGLVLDVKNTCWYFWDNPTHKYPFGEELDTPSIVEKISSNTCQLREGDGESLTSAQKEKLNLLLESFQNVFKPGGEATHILEHHINTGNSPPIFVPPYRMSPVKKEILRKEIEDLLEKDIIEECESPYGAPVVLIPKPNNQFRLCIDYRKLNEVTVSDTYPLPRMDDLLQEAKHTAYISTIDLKSGYHQVNVNPADRDKTAFVCPFGTYRFKRMPFGLKNAPATFQRLMDLFRRGLPVLAYLDDIIIMSPTFEQRLADLEAVFKRLMDFKLRANSEKCQFSCSRVKYLGLWITPQGIEVDHEKTSAILGIPPPKNVKQLQSFLQTCSWYRKFIVNFSEIAQPLSNLTKKKAFWKWSEEEEKAFQTLKRCLVSPPILK
ncbi:hypothetical protein TNCV_3479551 [Trichonephila clavipes]|nr:hypothetical protein TNCV_3479551 [Trichonephila clavipes]